MVPRAVLMKSGLVSIDTARQVNTSYTKLAVNGARTMSNLSKTAHLTVKRPINKYTTSKNSNFNQRVNTVRVNNVNTARPKALVNVVRGNSFNVLKASACWVWRPKQKVLDHVSKYNRASITLKKFDYGNPQMDLHDQGVIDSRCSRHMTGNMSYLTDYEEIDGGYVTFGGKPKGGKITGKAVNTACYVQNRVLVVKPHNKNPYELFHGRPPILSFMRPFGCPVTILNTIDHLGKFDGKADEGFFVGYSLNSKAFRVFNSKTRIVEENLHIKFSESIPNVAGSGPNWLFDIDALTMTMNYEPVDAGNQSNGNVGTKASVNASQARKEIEPGKDYILLLLWPADLPFSQGPKSSQDDGSKPSSDDVRKVDEDPRKESECEDQEKEDDVNNTNNINNVSSTVNDAGIEVNVVGRKTSIELPDDPNMPALEDDSIFRYNNPIFEFSNDDEDDGAMADINNLDTTIQVSFIPTTRIHKDYPIEQVIGDLQSTTQTRNMSKNLEEHGFICTLKQRTHHKDLQNCLFACFLSQEEPKKSDFLYGKIEEEVYVCQPPGFEDPDFPDKVYKVKKALYGLHQAPRAWYETLSTYLLDNGFQRGTINKTLFIKRHKGDILLVQVYVDDIIFGSTNKELCIGFEKLMHEKFQMSSMGELTFFLGLQVNQKKDGIFISQDKYVAEILKKFGYSEVKTANTPMETHKPLLKDEDGEEVDVHMYRSMIGSLMYLTSSKPDIMFAVCAYARYQVNPKERMTGMEWKSLFGMELKLMLFWSTTKAKTINEETQIHALVDGKKIVITESSVRRDLQLADEEGKDFSGKVTPLFATMMVQHQSAVGEGSAIPTDPQHTPTIDQPSNTQPIIAPSTSQAKKTKKPRKHRKDTKIPQSSSPIEPVADEAVYKKRDDNLVRTATTASSLEVEQDSGNITKTRSKATLNKPSSQ
ncbi:putative ribonuclease H-like domain-containing protein [Tanacetum coccineum]